MSLPQAEHDLSPARPEAAQPLIEAQQAAVAGQIVDAVSARAQVDARLDELLLQARELRITYARLGELLGMSEAGARSVVTRLEARRQPASA